MLQAISPCTQANSEWMFAWNNSHKLSGPGERYIMQPLQNQNLELVLAVVLKTGTAAVLLGTLCFFVFFFFPPFSMAVTDAENRKKIGRGPGSYPVHMLYYATCSPRSIVKSKTHDNECFRTFSPIGDILVGWEETILSSWCESPVQGENGDFYT